MPNLKTINFVDAQSGQTVPVSVSQLPDGSYSLVVDERSVHNLGVAGAAFITADGSAAPAAVTDTPPAGQRLVVDELICSSNVVNITLTFTEETSGTILLRIYISGNQSVALIGNDRIKLATPGKRLMVQSDKVGAFSVTALWYSEA